MANITPKLAQYQFTPSSTSELSDPPRFSLKPLTEPQVVELFETYKDGQPTEQTWYRAGCMGIVSVENLTIDNKPARWPAHKDVIPYVWISECGVDLCMQAWSPDDPDSIEGLEKN